MKRLYGSYIQTCRRKNIFWGLTLEQFHEITSRPCHYCGKEPLQISRTYRYNGIDRMDNQRGYTLLNSVSACKTCNFLKGANLTYEEAKVVCGVLARVRADKLNTPAE